MRIVTHSVWACVLLAGLLCLDARSACAVEPVAEAVDKSTVVFIAKKHSLRGYAAELESQTGVTVLLDRLSLQQHGISINQPISMPKTQLSVADALDMMTEKVAFTNPGKVLWKIDEKERAVIIYGK